MVTSCSGTAVMHHVNERKIEWRRRRQKICKQLFFDIHVTVHPNKFLMIKPTLIAGVFLCAFDGHACLERIIFIQQLLTFLIMKPTRCTNFSNLFLEGNSTCFGELLCPSSGVFHCTHNNGVCHTGLLTACEQEHLLLHASFQQTCMTYTITVFTVKTPDDGQSNCPKHVEFPSKNKFEKLVHIVGFIIRNVSSYWMNIILSRHACPSNAHKDTPEILDFKLSPCFDCSFFSFG